MDQQQGFRTERGTADGIFIIKRVHQIINNMNKPIYVLFIDLTAAFDHVNRDLMFETIQNISKFETIQSSKQFKDDYQQRPT